VHHLIVGQGQNKVLVKGVQEGEGQFVHVKPAVDRVIGHEAEHIVHPAHVPLEEKTEAAQVNGPGHARPGRGLFGDGDGPWKTIENLGIEVLDELDGVQVLPPAVTVGDPLSLLSGIIQIEHGGHGIHPQPVYVVPVEPVEGIGHQKVLDLIAAVVEDQGVPVLLNALPGIRMFVQMGPVIEFEGIAVPGEVGRNPVQDHADPLGMAAVHQISQVVRRAVAGRHRIVSGHLIAP